MSIEQRTFFIPLLTNYRQPQDVRDAFRDAVWQAEMASGYGITPGALSVKDIDIPTQAKYFPAVTILRGTRKIPFISGRDYHSSLIPKEQVARVVKVTQEEMKTLTKLEKPEKRITALRRLLTRKTLAAVKEIIEAEASKKKS